MAATNAAPKKGPLYKFLHQAKCVDVIADQKGSDVITLLETDSVEKAVGVLSKAGILSAPVLNKSEECIGFVDMLDIAKYIVSAAPSDQSLNADQLGSLKIAGRAIALVPVKSVVDASGHDPFVTVYEDSPASQLADVFAAGVHRAVLFNTKKQLAYIVSQSDVNRFLSKEINRGHLKEVGAKSLKDLGYVNEKIETISQDSTVLEALKKLNNKGVSALAVVDGQGKLVGNFSASDLRGLYKEKFPAFLESVIDYLKARSPGSLQPVVGEPKTSLIDISRELAEKKLHHMWVVDEFKPVGSISLTDIMRITVADA